jgi:hypothetical protein
MKNPLVTDKDKDAFCFRSKCSQTLTEKQLAKEMAAYNSSFTEADNVGILNVLNTVVIKHLSKGYSVELPFGSIRPNATGTCSSIQDSFSLGHGNNQINIIFSLSDEAKKEVASKLEYEQLPPDTTGDPKIYRLNSLTQNAKESENLDFQKGQTLRIRGRNLSFDYEDENQGVFLENEDGLTKIQVFTRAGTNVIDLPIPSELAAGEYTVSVVTKPGSFYYNSSYTVSINVA